MQCKTSLPFLSETLRNQDPLRERGRHQSLFILPQYASWPDNLGDYVSLNGLDACQETTLVNANVSSDRTANGCSVEVSYSTVKSGKKLTINHEISTELGLGFSMEPGSELEIK